MILILILIVIILIIFLMSREKFIIINETRDECLTKCNNDYDSCYYLGNYKYYPADCKRAHICCLNACPIDEL